MITQIGLVRTKKNRVMHCCDWFTLSFDYIYSIKQTVIKISDNQTKKHPFCALAAPDIRNKQTVIYAGTS